MEESTTTAKVQTFQFAKKRDPNWSHVQILLLLDLWSKYASQLACSTSKLQAYSKMQKELPTKTTKQIKKKIAQLKQKYRKEVSIKTNDSPSNWVYYEKIHTIIQTSLTFSQSTSASQQPNPRRIVKVKKEPKIDDCAEQDQMSLSLDQLDNSQEEINRNCAERIENLEKKIDFVVVQLHSISAKMDTLIQLKLAQNLSSTQSSLSMDHLTPYSQSSPHNQHLDTTLD